MTDHTKKEVDFFDALFGTNLEEWHTTVTSRELEAGNHTA